MLHDTALIYSREAIGFTDLTAEERDAFSPVRQRLVPIHPVTGRKSLFLSAHAGTIEGLDRAGARMFLRVLAAFATQPRFVYAHDWRVNDLVIWDNRTTMHRPRRFDQHEVRDGCRTTIGGDAVTIEQAA